MLVSASGGFTVSHELTVNATSIVSFVPGEPLSLAHDGHPDVHDVRGRTAVEREILQRVWRCRFRCLETG